MNTVNANIAQLTISPELRRASKPRFVWPLLAVVITLCCLAYLTSFSVLEVNAKPTKALQAAQVNEPVLAETATTPALAVKSPATTITPSPQRAQDSVLDASGHIVARRIATVSSQVTGKLNALLIEEGQQVGVSQVMAQLDDQQAQISLALAKADAEAVLAKLAELEVQVRHQQQRYQRQLKLMKDKLLSQQHLDDVSLSLAQLNAQVDSQNARLKLAQQKVALAEYNLSQHQIKAPFDGIVISKNAQVGELISAGNSGGSIRTGVGTIVDMSSLEIEVEVAEAYINRVFAGQQALATLDAYPNWSIKSEVITVIPTADRQKASIKVRIKLLAQDPRILPDMGVKVSFYS